MSGVRALVRQGWAGLRLLLVLTVVLGVLYPLAVTGVVQLPGLRSRADGSTVSVDGHVVGSTELGQAFTGPHGRPLARYFQSRPSTGGYDPTATGGSNLGPESVVDAPGAPSLLTQVCRRSLAVGRFDGVNGRRPYCADGVGAALRVFRAHGTTGRVTRVVSANQACPERPFVAEWHGVRVGCSSGATGGVVVLVRGDAPADPAVPADAVTASASGVDPDISPAYARIQVDRVARARGVRPSAVAALVARYTSGRELGFLGEPTVNVLQLNLALDRIDPIRP